MKAAVWYGQKDVRVEDREREQDEAEVVERVGACALGEQHVQPG